MAEEPAPFVNRDDEIELVSKAMHAVAGGQPVNAPIFHFYSVPLTGCTALLRHLATRDWSEVPNLSRCYTALVRCDTLEPTEPLRTIAESIHQQFQEQEIAFSERTGARSPEQDLAALRARVLDIAGQSGSVPLLLFDAADRLNAETFAALEAGLIAPLVEAEAAVIVVSGRKERPVWSQIATRRRMSKHELSSFNKGDTKRQLWSLGITTASPEEVYRITRGHPYANQVLGRAGHNLADKDWLRGELQRIEEQLLRDVPDTDCRQALRLLSILFPGFGSGTPRPPRQNGGLHLLSIPLPGFGPGTARVFLENFDMDWDRLARDCYFPPCILDLAQEPRFAISPSVRAVMAERFYLDEPDRYCWAHQCAANIYTKYARNLRDAKVADHLLAMVYHRVQAQRHRLTSMIRNTLADDIWNNAIQMLYQAHRGTAGRTQIMDVYDQLRHLLKEEEFWQDEFPQGMEIGRSLAQHIKSILYSSEA